MHNYIGAQAETALSIKATHSHDLLTQGQPPVSSTALTFTISNVHRCSVWFCIMLVLFGTFNTTFKKMEVARWQHGYVQEAPTTLFQNAGHCLVTPWLQEAPNTLSQKSLPALPHHDHRCISFRSNCLDTHKHPQLFAVPFS